MPLSNVTTVTSFLRWLFRVEFSYHCTYLHLCRTFSALTTIGFFVVHKCFLKKRRYSFNQRTRVSIGRMVVPVEKMVGERTNVMAATFRRLPGQKKGKQEENNIK